MTALFIERNVCVRSASCYQWFCRAKWSE